MKYKFYDVPPEISFSGEDRQWPEEACNNTWILFRKEIAWIAKCLDLDINKLEVDDVTFGDPVVFHGGAYLGYLLSDFYLAMDTDDRTYWEFDN